MKKLFFIPLILFLLLSELSCMNPDIPEEPDEDAILKLVEVSGNILGIDLTNDVPVQGVQFTLEGPKITEGHTTSRTEGFLLSFNEENGKVILLSLSGGKIATGKGLIAEILHDNSGSASLSEIKIVK